LAEYAGVREETQNMTLNGTINKVGILVVLTVASALWGWSMAESEIAGLLLGGSAIAALILSFVIIFNKSKAPILAPCYAVAEGMVLGIIAYMADMATKGAAVQAFTITFAILFGMLGLYRIGLIRATETFRKVMAVAMLGVLITYVVDMVMGFFGTSIPMVHQGTPAGMIFSLIVIGIASLNFVLDFDMIERGVAARAPKWMEWYAGFAVLLTIVWLYIEVLRLLGKRR
jgi:uncharacterized YccA/Bax inhibitor family protein